MRKVYQVEKSSLGFTVSLLISLGVTATIFTIIPFTHIIAKPGRTLELRKASAAELPPPVEEQWPAPPPPQKPPEEAPQEPQLAETPQTIALSADLDVAVGSGGALAGFGEARALAAAQPIQEETFDVSELEKKPEPVSQAAPVYPPDLRKAKIEGVVTIVFVLDENGRVAEPRVENSSRPEFEKPALDAIRKWRFRPGMKEGKAVSTYVRIPMRFRVTSS
ncbi:MAG: TonB family protein [Verrucomicrobiota bacterium]